MKKILCFIITAFLIVNCFVFSVSASENSFYVSDAVIITPENPSITDKYAAERLKYYLDKIEDSSLNGEKYNLLIVPYSEDMPEYVTEKLKKADIKVVTVSERECETGFENITIENLIDYMNSNKYYDVRSDYEGIFLRYYHYTPRHI